MIKATQPTYFPAVRVFRHYPLSRRKNNIYNISLKELKKAIDDFNNDKAPTDKIKTG